MITTSPGWTITPPATILRGERGSFKQDLGIWTDGCGLFGSQLSREHARWPSVSGIFLRPQALYNILTMLIIQSGLAIWSLGKILDKAQSLNPSYIGGDCESPDVESYKQNSQVPPPREVFLLLLISSVQSLSRVWLFATPWTAALQASLSITNSQSLLKLMSSDATQPSHPLLSPAPPAFNLSQHQGLFQWVGSSHQVAKVLEFQLQHRSFQWIFRTDFL